MGWCVYLNFRLFSSFPQLFISAGLSYVSTVISTKSPLARDVWVVWGPVWSFVWMVIASDQSRIGGELIKNTVVILPPPDTLKSLTSPPVWPLTLSVCSNWSECLPAAEESYWFHGLPHSGWIIVPGGWGNPVKNTKDLCCFPLSLVVLRNKHFSVFGWYQKCQDGYFWWFCLHV